jgi:hypothetical protein
MKRFILLAIAVAAIGATRLDAHHPVVAKFDTAATRSLTGPITEIDWADPHAHIFVNAISDGTVTNWAVELDTPSRLERAGWDPDSVEVGTVITVDGFPARDGSRQVWANSIVVDADGREVFTSGSPDPEPPAVSGPAPRWEDGQVRLSPDERGLGFWAAPSTNDLMEEGVQVEIDFDGLIENISDASEVAPLQPWALALYEDRQRDFMKDDPSYLHCLPLAGPRQFLSPLGVQFIEDRVNERIFVLHGSANNNWRLIYMDGRDQVGSQAGDADNPLYFGRSVGHWEGDTLVVDSVGFNERFWMSKGGLPHTDDLHTVERITRTNAGTLEYEVLIDDPGAYTRPWTARWTLSLVENERLPQHYCQDNRP